MNEERITECRERKIRGEKQREKKTVKNFLYCTSESNGDRIRKEKESKE